MMGDGHGLWLQVRTAANKSWLFRYRLGGKARAMGLGPVRLIPLAKAREAAEEAARLVRQGIDPIERRKQDRLVAIGASTTFRKAAEAHLAAKLGGWRSAKHKAQWAATLATYAYPVIGDMGVATITASDVKRVLDPIWKDKAETASRVRGRIEAVLDGATAAGWRSGDNPARWRGSMKHLMADKPNRGLVKHYPALPWDQVAGFMSKLLAQEGVAARALEFTILTAARSGETLGMTWGEVDQAAKVWTVPAVRMKASREHRVPLSAAAAAVLAAMGPLRREVTGDYVFPGGKIGRHLSDMAMTATLRRMGRGDITVHGFRSTFRDWCGEATNHPREVAEAALAHTLADKVEAAYRRGDALAKRAALMADWATFCATPPAAAGATE